MGELRSNAIIQQPQEISISTVVLDNFQRINRVEESTKDLVEKFDSLEEMVKALHEDLIGRRATKSVISTLLKYAGWAVGVLGAAMGVKESQTVFHWLSSFPGGGGSH